MTNGFNKQTCLNTIYALARMRGVKISTIEEQAGVSQGYFSKMRKTENMTPLSVDVLVRIAEILGVTIDIIITGTSVMLSPLEQMPYYFIDKLMADTMYNRIVWTREEPEELVSYKYEDYAYNNGNGVNGFSHPLIESGMPCDMGGGNGHYVSKFFGDNTPSQDNVMTGAIYHTDIGNNNYVYISKIVHNVYDNMNMPKSYEAIELYVLDVNVVEAMDGKSMTIPYVRPVCCSAMVHQDIHAKMWELYQLLDTNYSSIPMTPELEAIINGYMQK
ncbi:MAG: XRE family transcriptional regulator [Lachnospiraceae bacterium]|nr:XRE family transcriptional regulator [Lachnospiraceae bacterium]